MSQKSFFPVLRLGGVEKKACRLIYWKKVNKKAVLNFFLPAIVLSLFLSLIHWYLRLDLIFLWFGVFLGTLLWQTDHLFYIWLKAPYEYTSLRFIRYLQSRKLREAFQLLVETKDERPRTLFCSVLFQGFLFVLAFFVLTSSSSILGKGLVLGLLFQALTYQGRQFLQKGEITSWFWQFKAKPSRNLQALYFGLVCLLFLFFGLFLV